MPLIDEVKTSKLKKLNMNIKTKYICGHSILERNTDDSYNDNVENGVICEKQFFVSNRLKHTEKIFDTRMEYSFVSSEKEDNDYTCPNCGMTSKLKEFKLGCPYCRTHYNIEYKIKDLGSKYHYDLVIRSSLYKIITAFVDIIVSLLLSYIFIKNTSRTFNSYDISKVFIYGFILALILYYFFYIIDGYIILGPIKKYKEKQNQKQIQFWERTKIDKKAFFNNLNYEINNMYSKMDSIIDYDILDFLDFNEFKVEKTLYVKVKIHMRVIKYIKGKFLSKYVYECFTMKKITDDVVKLTEGENIIKCPNCGASIDVTKNECEYCHTKTKYFQEWILC